VILLARSIRRQFAARRPPDHRPSDPARNPRRTSFVAALMTSEWRTVRPMRDPERADRWCGDEVLVARLRAGDDRALGRAYDEHAEVVLATARRVTLDDQLAHDVVQEVFVHLWASADRVDLARGSLRAYLRTIAHRRAVDAVRRSERRHRAETQAAAAPTTVVDVAGADVSVTDAAAARWCNERRVAALGQLPDDQRAALELAYFGGQTLKQVAATLGIPEGTAKSRVRLGLARVRAIVGEDLRETR
jgi:RNA polymerase sigma-70 factor (ECF subfamily)